MAKTNKINKVKFVLNVNEKEFTVEAQELSSIPVETIEQIINPFLVGGVLASAGFQEEAITELKKLTIEEIGVAVLGPWGTAEIAGKKA